MIESLDIPSIVYTLTAVVGVYGFSLFAWWWRKIGSATEVYVYVTFLFFGVFVTSIIGLYSRYLHYQISCDVYDIFVKSHWWSLGPVMILAVLIGICWRMTRRVYILRHGTESQISKELRLMTCPHCGRPCPRWEVEEANYAKERSNNK